MSSTLRWRLLLLAAVTASMAVTVAASVDDTGDEKRCEYVPDFGSSTRGTPGVSSVLGAGVSVQFFSTTRCSLRDNWHLPALTTENATIAACLLFHPFRCLPLAFNLTNDAPVRTFTLAGDCRGNYTFELQRPRGPLPARVLASVTGAPEAAPSRGTEQHNVLVGESALTSRRGAALGWQRISPIWNDDPDNLLSAFLDIRALHAQARQPVSTPLWPNWFAAPLDNGGAELWWFAEGRSEGDGRYNPSSYHSYGALASVHTAILASNASVNIDYDSGTTRVTGTLTTSPSPSSRLLVSGTLSYTTRVVVAQQYTWTAHTNIPLVFERPPATGGARATKTTKQRQG